MATIRATKRAVAAAVFAAAMGSGDMAEGQDQGGKDGKAWVRDNTLRANNPAFKGPLVEIEAADVEMAFFVPDNPQNPKQGGKVVDQADVRSVDVSRRGEAPRYERRGPNGENVAAFYVNAGAGADGRIDAKDINDLRFDEQGNRTGFEYKEVWPENQHEVNRQAREQMERDLPGAREELNRAQQEALAAQREARVAASGKTPEQLQYSAAFGAVGAISRAGGDTEKLNEIYARAPAYKDILEDYARRLENGESASALRREYQTKVTARLNGNEAEPGTRPQVQYKQGAQPQVMPEYNNDPARARAGGVMAQQQSPGQQAQPAQTQMPSRAAQPEGMDQRALDVLKPEGGMPNAAIIAADEVRNKFWDRNEMTDDQLQELIQSYDDVYPQVAALLREEAEYFANNPITRENSSEYTRRMGEVAVGAMKIPEDRKVDTPEEADARTEALNERRRAAAYENAQGARDRLQARIEAVSGGAENHVERASDGSVQLYRMAGDENVYVLWHGPDENGQPQNLLLNNEGLNEVAAQAVNPTFTLQSITDYAGVLQAIADAQNAIIYGRSGSNVQDIPNNPAQIRDPELREAVERHVERQTAEPQASTYDSGFRPNTLG